LQRIDPVPERQEGVPIEHARTGISHYRLDSSPQVRNVAMDGTLGAGRFIRGKRASAQAANGIFVDLATFRAETIDGRVPPPAEDLDHRTHGALLAIDPPRFALRRTGHFVAP
jgi:hypothetical protein